ncbi:RICIN domain-containing protein [Streptomyces nondiastaticus]|uniref:RICIN domain-containing protein n=1 Tax=Streptomyces nondiastaticus TaxID=3154512 RepID=UPI003417DC3C
MRWVPRWPASPSRSPPNDRARRSPCADIRALRRAAELASHPDALESDLNGKCLDVADGNGANGAALNMWDCNGSAQQQWHVG